MTPTLQQTKHQKQSYDDFRPIFYNEEFVKKEYLTKKEKKYFLIGSKKIDKYILVPKDKVDIVTKIISKFDGTHSIEEIKKYMLEEYNLKVDVKTLYKKLDNAGLIKNSPNFNKSASEKNIFFRTLFTLDISRVLKTTPAFLHKLRIPVVIFFWINIALSVFLMIFLQVNNNIAIFELKTVFGLNGSVLFGLFAMQVIGFLSIIFHEASHIITAIYYNNLSCKVNFSLYAGLFPFLYTDIHNIYLMPKRERMNIWAAGLYTNLFFVVFSFNVISLIHLISPADIIAKAIFWKFMLSNLLMLIANSIPLLPSDGYFIFSSIFNITNMRTRVIKNAVVLFKKGRFEFTYWELIYFILNAILMIIGLILYGFWIFSATKEIYNFVKGPCILKSFVAALLPVFLLYQLWVTIKKMKNMGIN